MKIDLLDKVQRVLVQEYVNKICNYESEEELNWNVHKLIHTFQVVQMAQKLIDKTKEKLSPKIKKEIINSAILHDLGRCYEFKKGKHLKTVDHGKIGACLILKYFPDMKLESKVTLFHNKLPSLKDPKEGYPILDYVRDADMLANIQYNIEHFDVFIQHIVFPKRQKLNDKKIDEEIINSIKEKRSPNIRKIKKETALTMFLWQLCWYYNLRTRVAKEFSKKEKLFLKYRQCVCEKLIPLMKLDKKEQLALEKQIKQVFPESLFL